jgi:hypothetical protein
MKQRNSPEVSGDRRRRQSVSGEEKHAASGDRGSKSIAEAYQDILARELLINDYQESLSKYF